MKKVLSIVLSALIALSGISVFADADTSSAMRDSLVSVKQKVDVPENLTEFQSSSYENDGIVNYTFDWNNKDYTSNLSIGCDSKGRITSYYFYDSNLRSEDLFSDIGKAEITEFADGFMRRLVPEAFADENDTLVMNEDFVSSYGSQMYRISYDRFKDGVKVKNGSSSVNVFIYENKLYVRNANIDFDYDAKFEAVETEIENYAEIYEETFPIELIYKNYYGYEPYYPINENDEEKDEIILEYRIKDDNAGYISAVTGEEVTEDTYEYGGGGAYKEEAVADDTAANMSMGALMPYEIEELDNIKGLISKEDALKILKALPYVDFESGLELSSSRIYQNDDGEYFMRVRYTKESEKDFRSISANFNAQAGKLLSYNDNQYYDANTSKATKAQMNTADEKIAKFLNSAAGEDMSVFAEQSAEWFENSLNKRFDRIVNDIRYIDNGIYVTYDAYKSRIIDYNLNYDADAEFVLPDGIISADEAYAALVKAAPIEKIYVLSDGEYKLCYALSEFGTEIDAFTGEKIEYGSAAEKKPFDYTDIKGHWAEEAVTKLANIKIGFKGDEFKPDEVVTQADLLRLFGAGIYYNSFIDYDDEQLYEHMYSNEIITEEEKAPTEPVTRENAFVYMIRMAELEKIAKASEIFKVEYADGNLLSEGRIGYPAILTGLNVICGYGGNLRPQESITRAEAATMIYKYMLNNK